MSHWEPVSGPVLEECPLLLGMSLTWKEGVRQHPGLLLAWLAEASLDWSRGLPVGSVSSAFKQFQQLLASPSSCALDKYTFVLWGLFPLALKTNSPHPPSLVFYSLFPFFSGSTWSLGVGMCFLWDRSCCHAALIGSRKSAGWPVVETAIVVFPTGCIACCDVPSNTAGYSTLVLATPETDCIGYSPHF